MTPDEHPTLEEWIAATQSCCGVDHDDNAEAEVPKNTTDERKPLVDTLNPPIAQQ